MSSFEVALSEYLRAQQNLQERHASNYWHPSMFGKCDVEAIMKREGVEAAEFSDETLRKFWMGNTIHEALQLAAPFEVLGSEKTTIIKDDDYKISGRTDGLVVNEGIVEVLEFKSTKDTRYIPSPSHILQAGAYLAFTIFCPHPEEGCSHEDKSVPYIYSQPERARLVYWHKRDDQPHEFIIQRNALLTERVQETLLRLESLYQKYKETGELPKPEFPESDFRAKFCNYRGTGRCCQENLGNGGELPVQTLSPEVRSPAPRTRGRKRVAKGEGSGPPTTSMPGAEKLPF